MSEEYIACQQENHGVLILSEFAGAAHSLNGSLIVNPWNTEETAAAIHRALTMSSETREESYRKLWQYISKFTASRWGTSFVYELQQLRLERREMAKLEEAQGGQRAELQRKKVAGKF